MNKRCIIFELDLDSLKKRGFDNSNLSVGDIVRDFGHISIMIFNEKNFLYIEASPFQLLHDLEKITSISFRNPNKEYIIEDDYQRFSTIYVVYEKKMIHLTSQKTENTVSINYQTFLQDLIRVKKKVHKTIIELRPDLEKIKDFKILEQHYLYTYWL